MKYLYSKLDRDNLSWFSKDMTIASLSEVSLLAGSLRGLNPFKIEFRYPISVIAGRNRSGKSTILAMAACAFHNEKGGFKLPERKLSYYTISDFFIQSSEEVSPDGVFIHYRIRHNNWKRSRRAPRRIGNLHQIRSKKKGGKWNKYSRRVKRNVVYFGVQRVVPPSERSVSKTYRALFSDGTSPEWETEVKDIVGRILGVNYDDFKMKTYSKYRLPAVTVKQIFYSGFNMGAGENALFEIFSTIFASPRGTLLVIDEIELGLHEEAQGKFINELKKVCRSRRLQVICTTHSPAILDAIPPEGRFYIQSYPSNTIVTPGITSLNAAGLLSGDNSKELDIFIEDTPSHRLIEALLVNDIRKRVIIIPIGSPPTIIRQMAARYKENKPYECIAVMDGDQCDNVNSFCSLFIDALESCPNRDEAEQWFKERISFLPGNTWPEKWIIESLQSLDTNELAEQLKISNQELCTFLDQAMVSGKHNEFHDLSQNLCLEPSVILYSICQWIVKQKQSDFKCVDDLIHQYLP